MRMHTFILHRLCLSIPLCILLVAGAASAQLQAETDTGVVTPPPAARTDADIASASEGTGWYHPLSIDPKPVVPEVVPPPKPRAKRLYLTLASDTVFHGGKLNNVNMEGVNNLVLMRFGGAVGMSIGLVAPGPYFFWSFDILRSAAVQVGDFGSTGLWILMPTLSLELTMIDGFDAFSLGAGAALTGLRITICKSVGVVFDLRLPTVHYFNSLGTRMQAGQYAFPIGASLDVGLLF